MEKRDYLKLQVTNNKPKGDVAKVTAYTKSRFHGTYTPDEALLVGQELISEVYGGSWIHAVTQKSSNGNEVYHYFVRFQPVIDVPESLKGIIIGRKGTNIRDLCKRANTNIKIK